MTDLRAISAVAAGELAAFVGVAKNISTNGWLIGTTGWGTTNATFTVDSRLGTLTATAAGGYVSSAVAGGTIIDHVYYATAQVSATSSAVKMGLGSSAVWHTGGGGYESLSLTHVATSTGHGISIVDGRTSGWSAVKLHSVVCFDLTAIYGAGAEPSAAYMNRLIDLLPGRWLGYRA